MTDILAKEIHLPIFLHMISSCWYIFESSAAYMLFGFFIAGILYIFLRTDKIGSMLGGGNIRPVFLSALIGIPIPLCSCGVVPAAAGLRKQGASKGATLSFLISTPESGIDSISITYALLDPIMTVARPLSAFITGMVAGFMENRFGIKAFPPPTLPTPPAEGGYASDRCEISATAESRPAPAAAGGFRHLTAKLSAGLSYAFVELLGDVGKWFLLGILIAGAITVFVPNVVFTSVSGSPFLAMLLAMAAGIPMYVCATSSTPIAAALILKGFNPGAALVFLLLGPATNIASMSMVYGLMGRRSLLIYLGSMIVCSLSMGFVVDGVYGMLHLVPGAVAGRGADVLPPGVELVSALVLGALLLYSIAKPYFSRGKEDGCTCCTTCSH